MLPILRFPGFEGEWEEKMLGDVCEILNNRREPISSEKRVKGIYPYYGASGIVDYVQDFIFNERLLLVGEDGAKWGSFEKTAFIANGKYWVNNHAHVLKTVAINDVFLENYLVMLDINPLIAGAAPPKLTLGILKKIVIPVPKDTIEQQKIADCLSSLDDLITAETQKLEALKTYKKGLMQVLFPAEGEKVPRLRFPGFEGEWEEKMLGEVATFINGRAYAQEELLATGKYRVLRVGNFFSSKDWYYSNLELEDNKFCNNGDLLYAWSASFGPRIWQGEKAIYHYHIWKVVEKDQVCKQFLYWLLELETEKIKSNQANGLGLLHITKNSIEKWDIHIPSLQEQQKIADCISSIDNQITTAAQKIETLKQHKKGLMQQLFPNA